MESQTNQFENQTYGPQQQALPNATAVLVLGIVSIVGCFCYGIVGIICGIIAMILAKKDLALYEANPGAYTSGSYSNLKSGRICAIIGLSLSAIYIVFVVITLITVGTGILTNPSGIFNRY